MPEQAALSGLPGWAWVQARALPRPPAIRCGCCPAGKRQLPLAQVLLLG